MTAAGIDEGPLFRVTRKGNKVMNNLSDWAAWSVVEQAAKQIGIECFRSLRSPQSLRQALQERRFLEESGGAKFNQTCGRPRADVSAVFETSESKLPEMFLTSRARGVYIHLHGITA